MTTTIDWQPFIARASAWPHETTRRAVAVSGPGADRAALDVGCGNGRDALLLADSGFNVSAVDISPAAPVIDHPRVHCYRADIVEFPLSVYALINASLVLPFVPRRQFDGLWTMLVAALAPGGVFAGHFAGTRDWRLEHGHAWGCEVTELERMLSSFSTVSISENELDAPNASGAVVHKHNYEVVAQKA